MHGPGAPPPALGVWNTACARVVVPPARLLS